ncbi:MAG: hypothetical protein WKG01_22495 [Kofleriaceae bacterium]
MGQPQDRQRAVTATDELPLNEVVPEPRLAKGTVVNPSFELDGHELQRGFVELRSLVIEVVERVVSPDDQKRIFVFAPDTVFGWVDPPLVEHVLGHLITCALARSPGAGSVVVRIEERRDSAWVSITDNALVLPGDRGVRRADRGALESVLADREIIQAHGGRLDVARLANASTRCTVELPLAATAIRPKRLTGALGLLVGSRLPHVTQLIQMLTSEGMVCKPVCNRDDAMRAVRKHRPQAVIVDAELGGLAVVQELRRLLPDTLILVVTRDPTTRLRSREPVILLNPIDAGELFAVITRRLAVSALLTQP